VYDDFSPRQVSASSGLLYLSVLLDVPASLKPTGRRCGGVFCLVRSSAPSHFTQAQRRSSVSDLLPEYNTILPYIYIKNDMKPLPTEGYSGLYFTTSTIKGWKHLLI